MCTQLHHFSTRPHRFGYERVWEEVVSQLLPLAVASCLLALQTLAPIMTSLLTHASSHDRRPKGWRCSLPAAVAMVDSRTVLLKRLLHDGEDLRHLGLVLCAVGHVHRVAARLAGAAGVLGLWNSQM